MNLLLMYSYWFYFYIQSESSCHKTFIFVKRVTLTTKTGNH